MNYLDGILEKVTAQSCLYCGNLNQEDLKPIWSLGSFCCKRGYGCRTVQIQLGV